LFIRYDQAEPGDYQVIRNLVKELGLQREDLL
jgi:hypothetical protein